LRIAGITNLLLTTLILLLPSTVSPQVVTNEQVVIEAAKSGVEENYKSMRFGRLVIDVSESEMSRPVAIGLSEGFSSLGIDIVGNGSSDSALQYLECDILGFEFKYENGDSRGFLRKRMLRRKFQAVIKMTFSDGRERSASETRDINISYEDQINPELAELVKSRNIAALDPAFPTSGMKKIVEPVIVTAAVGALIYLFFANR
jgi:hypothetical protein